MMKSLLGLSNTSPYIVKGWMKALRKSLKKSKRGQVDFTWLSPHDKFNEETKDYPIILCLGLEIFKKYQEQLLDTDSVVLIFDGPIVLGTAKIKMLDAVPINDPPSRWRLLKLEEANFISLLRLACSGGEPVNEDSLKQLDLLQSLIESRLGDLSSFVQTLTMKSREPSERKQIQGIIVEWLLSQEHSIQNLIEQLKPLVGRETTFVEKFFTTETGIDAIKVFKSIHAKLNGISNKPPKEGDKKKGINRSQIKKRGTVTIPYDKICMNTKISAFDAKFMMKAYKTRNEIIQNNLTCNEAQASAKTNALPTQETSMDFD